MTVFSWWRKLVARGGWGREGRRVFGVLGLLARSITTAGVEPLMRITPNRASGRRNRRVAV
jgi:hypothetical protein